MVLDAEHDYYFDCDGEGWSFNAASDNECFIALFGYYLEGEPEILFSNMNEDEVTDANHDPDGESSLSAVMVTENDILVVGVLTYHWNGGAGMEPGTVSLYDYDTDELLDVWEAEGDEDEDNTWWYCFPCVVLEAGHSYYFDCEDGSGWSYNAASDNECFIALIGYELIASEEEATEASAPEAAVNVRVNGVPVRWTDAAPFIDGNNRTMVPLRAVAEALGLSVGWDGERREASFSDGKGTITFPIDSSYAYSQSGAPIPMDTAAVIVNDRTYAPIRYLAEFFGFIVDWDGSSRTVLLRSTETGRAGEVLTAEEIYRKCAPAVFYIETYDEDWDILGGGSGFFLSSDGVAVTNWHVIEDAAYALIRVSEDAPVYNVDLSNILAGDEAEDWAVINVEGSGFQTLPVGSPTTVVAGAQIYAIGSPLGLEDTISEGIISNTNRVIDGTTYIQISAPISHGSSGGALLNKYGEVIGITAAGFDEGQNLNLAVPMRLVKYRQD